MEDLSSDVAGADRSGTVLMSTVLVSHPHIAMPHLGSNMWTFFYGQYGDLSRGTNFERCLAALLRYRNVMLLNPDPDRIRTEFRRGEPTYARLFALIHDHYAEQVGRPHWGDKSSYIERYADQIFAAYPGAKMIHMIRDPRDRFASAITRWPNSKGQVGGATARWIYSARLAQRNQRRYLDRYKIVRYETLVSQPEAVVREICAFLDEEYDPIMLTMNDAKRFVSRGGNSSSGGQQHSGISTASIGRFRKVLAKQDIGFIQAYAGPDMQTFNYERDPIRLSFGDRLLFYLVDRPINRARMLAWYGLE